MKNSVQKEEITKLVRKEFCPLSDVYGFELPVIANGRRSTQIDFLSTDIAIEIEIDWREFDAHILVVRLENGNLPKGYYVSNGRVCRKHLINIGRELGWDTTALQFLPSEGSLEEKLWRSLRAQKTLLFARVEEVKHAGYDLFRDRLPNARDPNR